MLPGSVVKITQPGLHGECAGRRQTAVLGVAANGTQQHHWLKPMFALLLMEKAACYKSRVSIRIL